MRVGKTNQQRTISVFLPSSTGLIAYCSLSLLILLSQNFSSLQQFFYSPQELQFQQDFWRSINERVGRVINFPGSSDFALYIFWAVVGLVVYACLHFVVSKLNELVDDINLRTYLWPNNRLRNRPVQEFFEVGVFKAVVFIVTLFYFKFIASFLLRPIDYIWQDNAWLSQHTVVKYSLVFVLSVVLLHGLTVLLRILMLRRRLFSSI